MADFKQQNLSGSRFEQVYLKDARFQEVDLTNTWFHNVYMTGVTIRGALVDDMEIDGDIRSLNVNGVDVVPLVEAELNRRDPERVKMAPSDADGFREAWGILERRWRSTVERARSFEPEQLHQSVNEEWSFIQTLRHLVFATDAWVNRALLGEPSPWHPLGLPHDEMPDIEGIPHDREARPSLDEILVVRADRQSVVRGVIEELTDERLGEMTEPVTEPGYPESISFPVRECLNTILSEEWLHRLFAERDFDELETGST